jgi:hypothetical protein
MEFHSTFRDLMNETVSDPRDPINSLDNNLPKTFDNVFILADIMKSGVKRPQILIDSDTDFYIAKDTKTNTIYKCFKNILIIDIDHEMDINHFNNYKDYAFRIFKTTRGYHIFCISQHFDYKNKNTIRFMLANLCDYYYVVYTFIRGFCVRLNPKFNETCPIYSDLGIFGDPDLIDDSIDSVVKSHLLLCDDYTDILCLPNELI